MTHVLYIDTQGWRIACATEGGCRWIPVADADAVVSQIDKKRAAIVLASSWCLCATVNNPPSRRRWRQAMQYELEEHLPVIAEDLVADYVIGKSQSFAVAARVSQLRPILSAMREASVEVTGIYPAALVALQHDGIDAQSADLLVLAGERQVDVLLLDAGKPLGWHVVKNDPAKIAARLGRFLAERRPCRLAVYGLADSDAHALAKQLDVELVQTRAAMVDTATLAAEVLQRSDHRVPLIDLLRPPLQEKNAARSRMEMLQVFAATVVLCLTAWIVALLWAGHQLDRRSAAMLQEQQAIFHDVLPQATRTSTQVVRRLESELQRLTDSGRAGSMADPVPTYATSAFSLLYEVFKGLPEASPDGGVSYRLTRLDVTGRAFRLDGIADTRDDADRIAQHLVDRAGVHVDPLRTDDAQDMGVRFTITGTRRSMPKGSLHLSKAIEP